MNNSAYYLNEGTIEPPAAGGLYDRVVSTRPRMSPLAAVVAVWNNDSSRSAERGFKVSIFYVLTLFARLLVDRAPGIAA